MRRFRCRTCMDTINSSMNAMVCPRCNLYAINPPSLGSSVASYVKFFCVELYECMEHVIASWGLIPDGDVTLYDPVREVYVVLPRGVGEMY